MSYLNDEKEYFETKLETVDDVMLSFRMTYLVSPVGMQYTQVIHLKDRDLCFPNDDLLRIHKSNDYKLN